MLPSRHATVLLACLLMATAGCGSDTPPASDMPVVVDLPPMDAPSTTDLPAAADIYAGTCLEAVVTCFDFSPPCTQMSLSSGPGFTATASNGAVYMLDIAAGTQQGTASDGTVCFSVTTDPATSDFLYTTPAGMIRERVDASGRTITCPDGSTQTAPAGDAPWQATAGQCT
jgi:hypothetical protein